MTHMGTDMLLLPHICGIYSYGLIVMAMYDLIVAVYVVMDYTTMAYIVITILRTTAYL